MHTMCRSHTSGLVASTQMPSLQQMTALAVLQFELHQIVSFSPLSSVLRTLMEYLMWLCYLLQRTVLQSFCHHFLFHCTITQVGGHHFVLAPTWCIIITQDDYNSRRNLSKRLSKWLYQFSTRVDTFSIAIHVPWFLMFWLLVVIFLHHYNELNFP